MSVDKYVLFIVVGQVKAEPGTRHDNYSCRISFRLNYKQTYRKIYHTIIKYILCFQA